MANLKSINEFLTGQREELNFATISEDPDTGLWHYSRYLGNTKEDVNEIFTSSEKAQEWHKQRFRDSRFIVLTYAPPNE